MKVTDLKERFFDYIEDDPLIGMLTDTITIRELIENNVSDDRLKAEIKSFADGEFYQCDNCGEYFDDRKDLDINMLCESCRNSKGEKCER
jgi:hypothetical protein